MSEKVDCIYIRHYHEPIYGMGSREAQCSVSKPTCSKMKMYSGACPLECDSYFSRK